MTHELIEQDLPVTTNLDRPMTVQEVAAQSMVIHQILTKVMVKGVHYGEIPGTGDKPTLLQPGAEKICTTFKLAPKQTVEDLSEPHNNLYRYRVSCALYTIRDGLFVGAAVGEASTAEEKYSWERAVCPEHWEQTDPTRRRIKYKRAGTPEGFETIQQVARNAADLANTVLKIAVKRAFISATRGATGASDLLEVDLDDDAVADLVKQEQTEQQPVKPKAKAKPAPPIPYGEHKGKPITDLSIPLGDLQHMADSQAANLDDPKRAKFKVQNQLFLAALDAEIAARRQTQAKEPRNIPQEPSQPAPGEAQMDKAKDSTESKPTAISDHLWADMILGWEESAPTEYAETKQAFKVASGHEISAKHRQEFATSMAIMINTKK